MKRKISVQRQVYVWLDAQAVLKEKRQICMALGLRMGSVRYALKELRREKKVGFYKRWWWGTRRHFVRSVITARDEPRSRPPR